MSTCGHAFTETTCSSGSFRGELGTPERSFIPSPAKCANCETLACDDCARPWALCSNCFEPICTACTATATLREVIARSRRTEYLCVECANHWTVIRKQLVEDLIEAADESEWLDQILADATAAIKRAEREM